MARLDRFVFLVSKDERQLIKNMAKRLQRSEGDAVRVVVVQTARELQSLDKLGGLVGMSDIKTEGK
jgi:hypothetical protein